MNEKILINTRKNYLDYECSGNQEKLEATAIHGYEMEEKKEYVISGEHWSKTVIDN